MVPQAELKSVGRVTLDRTKLAAKRTLMAWVRTARSMIGFVFFIYKVIQEQSTAAALRSQGPRNVGLTLTILLLIAVSAAGQQRQGGSADQRWNQLAAGNHRFVTGKTVLRNLMTERKALTNTQHPQVAVLSCSDSRVPPELVFDDSGEVPRLR
jgi:uncharacterized membrane protein YidH (DUF202 family)